MTKEKTNSANQDNISLYRWKLYEMCELGYRLYNCSVAYIEYSDFQHQPPNTELSFKNFDSFRKLHAQGNVVWHDSDVTYFLDHYFEIVKERKLIKELNLKTPQDISNYLNKYLERIDLYESESLEFFNDLCWLFCGYGTDYEKMSDTEKRKFMVIEHLIRSKACEAIGYWTARLEHKKRSKNQETKKQQREIKEEYIIDAWVHLTKDTNRKNILMSKSLNYMAQEIHNYVLPLLKDKKTATREYVLTRKFDKDGTIKYGGLSTDTIIDIMRNTKSDKFTFNPFKK